MKNDLIVFDIDGGGGGLGAVGSAFDVWAEPQTMSLSAAASTVTASQLPTPRVSCKHELIQALLVTLDPDVRAVMRLIDDTEIFVAGHFASYTPLHGCSLTAEPILQPNPWQLALYQRSSSQTLAQPSVDAIIAAEYEVVTAEESTEPAPAAPNETANPGGKCVLS